MEKANISIGVFNDSEFLYICLASMDREGFKTGFDPSGMMLPEGLTDLEILGPGKKDAVRMPIQDAMGIQVKASIDSGRIIYELKVPLGRSDKTPYAVGTGSGKNVTVGLETPDFNGGKGRGRAALRSGSADGEMPQEGGVREGEPGTGRGRGVGPGPGMGGSGMGPDGGRGFSAPEPLRFWVLVHLASQDASGRH